MGSSVLHNELALIKVQRMIRNVYPLINKGIKPVIVNPEDSTIQPVLIIEFHVTGGEYLFGTWFCDELDCLCG